MVNTPPIPLSGCPVIAEWACLPSVYWGPAECLLSSQRHSVNTQQALSRQLQSAITRQAFGEIASVMYLWRFSSFAWKLVIL